MAQTKKEKDKENKDKNEDKLKKIGNFRIDKKGNIDYFIGWASLEQQDIDSMEKILKIKYKLIGMETNTDEE